MSVADIEARTQQVYEDAALIQVQSYIIDITGLIEDFLGRSYATTEPPAAVRAIACREVMRYVNTDPGIATDRLGELSTGYAHQGAIEVLSDATESALRRYRNRRGIGSIQLVSRFIPDPVEDTGSTP
ncbi:hypothetical protein [Nonomuraea sp. ZG12]|uniref:hypothetical protein n=1 Tax=Nonomuraea sp. ZG12 TaxID=3452207 RepID=UPI003F89738B